MKFNQYILNTKFKTSRPRNSINLPSLNQAPVIKSMTDAEGIQKAYAHGDYHVFGNTLFIAGSHTVKDWVDDVTKVPFWGNTQNATRYIEAEKALKANPQVNMVVGHSLGGAVALELQKNHPYLKSRTYGSPTWDIFGTDAMPRSQWEALGKPDFVPEPNKIQRFRNIGDPVSMFDASAKTSVDLMPFNSYSLTHDYSKLGEKFTTEQVEAPTPGTSSDVVGSN